MKKISVKSPANIAFIKYWGRADHKLFTPLNNSISMNLSNCFTTTTISLVDSDKDQIFIKYYKQEYKELSPDNKKSKALFAQIKRIRKLANSDKKVKIYSVNNFPADAGIASSASSFSAITAALLLIYGLKDKFENKKELSRQIRLAGSGSAVRSCIDGFVEFTTGEDKDSVAYQIVDHNHWDLIDIVAIIDSDKKKVSSSAGHEIANTSPFLATRIEQIKQRANECKKAILDKDIEKLGQIIEQDAISLHAVMMTSKPPIYYWSPGSISIIQSVLSWRQNDNIPVYFSFDAGANAHLITTAQYQKEVENRLSDNPFVKWTITNKNCQGTHVINQHLF